MAYANLFELETKSVRISLPLGLSIKREIALRIRLARMAMGYTQRELAKALNCSEDTIWRLENEKRLPDIAECQAIAAITNQEASYFVI